MFCRFNVTIYYYVIILCINFKKLAVLQITVNSFTLLLGVFLVVISGVFSSIKIFTGIIFVMTAHFRHAIGFLYLPFTFLCT